MTASLVTADMEQLLGRDYPPVTYDVERSGIRLWARAVGYTDPVYYDLSCARERGHHDLPAPPGFLGHERYGADQEIGSQGPPIRGLNPRLTRSLNGGTEYEYHETVHAGDVLVATGRFTDYRQREGSIGPMLIITREVVFRRDGVPVVVMRATVINH